MPVLLDAAARKFRLEAIRGNNAERVGQQKLYYQEQNQSFDVFRIPLDLLIYNRHNGRLEVEMMTWAHEHVIPHSHYDSKLHQIIDDFLWKSNISRNRQTLADLEHKGQQRPGIVSIDGVIIDGNRRAMLLRRLQEDTGKPQFLDAIILPHAYAENEREIVRLETLYQMGEDAKLEYGALQKYLHARRLRKDHEIEIADIASLMGETPREIERILDTMALMDDYLEHIGCSGLYTLLRDSDGTKEGMFVDLYSDLKRMDSGNAKISWAFDPEVEPMQLRNIQFDYIRLNKFADAKKSYREISHQSKGKNFLHHQELWEPFRDAHMNNVDPVTAEMGTLEEFIAEHPHYESQSVAARARDEAWGQRVNSHMQANFNRTSNKLEYKMSELAPKEYLERAIWALEKVDVTSQGFLHDESIMPLVKYINSQAWDMKRILERAGY